MTRKWFRVYPDDGINEEISEAEARAGIECVNTNPIALMADMEPGVPFWNGWASYWFVEGDKIDV